MYVMADTGKIDCIVLHKSTRTESHKQHSLLSLVPLVLHYTEYSVYLNKNFGHSFKELLN